MKKAIIFYFSGTGNTWWVAKKIGRKLRDAAMKVRTVSIENIAMDEVQKLIEVSDIVGIGYPVYGAEMAPPMQAFIQQLATYKDKPSFVFCAQDSFTGDGTLLGVECLVPTGMDVKYSMHIHMPSHITSSILPLAYKYTPKEQNNLLRKVDKQIDKFVYYILEDIPGVVGFNKVTTALGSVKRLPYTSRRRKEQHMITFSKECTHCGYCEKICPVDNITITQQGNITYNECIGCMRCYTYCPENAVKLYGIENKSKEGASYKGPTRNFDPKVLKKD